MSPTRRGCLGVLGVAGLAGCLSGSSVSPTRSRRTDGRTTQSATEGRTTGPGTQRTSPTATDTPGAVPPGETYETAAGWSITVEPVGVYRSVVEFGVTHPNPVYEPGAQFVAVDVTTAGPNAPDPAELTLFARTDTLDRSSWRYLAAERNRADRRQRYGFPVPTRPAPTEGAIQWQRADGPDVSWRLPAVTLERIARPPSFELREFTARDVAGDEVAVAVTVANDGPGDGRFLAEAGHPEISDQPEIRVPVAAGTVRTATRRVWAPFEGDTTPVVLRWRGRTLERRVDREE